MLTEVVFGVNPAALPQERGQDGSVCVGDGIQRSRWARVKAWVLQVIVRFTGRGLSRSRRVGANVTPRRPTASTTQRRGRPVWSRHSRWRKTAPGWGCPGGLSASPAAGGG